MKPKNENEIIESWKLNVAPWIKAIEEKEITSRVEITNKAILDTLLSLTPKRVIDVGCGEGWLVRELVNNGIDATGIDIVPEFIEYAVNKGKGTFKVVAQEDISEMHFSEKFDTIVCNFSLLGDKAVENVFDKASSILTPGGHLVIQTLHPINCKDDEHYADGWQEGSWSGFNDAFSKPAPWYFRTLHTWKKMFCERGFSLITYEPINPITQRAESIIFIGRS